MMLVDVAYSIIDPRIRFQLVKKGGGKAKKKAAKEAAAV